MNNNKLDARFYPEIYQVVASRNYIVYAYLSDGSVREFDVKPLIEQGGIFNKLLDEKIFREKLTVLNGTVAWDIYESFPSLPPDRRSFPGTSFQSSLRDLSHKYS